MNREIKFDIFLRRKDGTDSYHEFLTLDDLLNRNGSLFHPGIWEVVYTRQFTGLHAKNGEVLEGDIVKCGYGTGKVIFHVGCFMVEWIEDKESMMELLYSRKGTYARTGDECFEVIGNIYSNPEPT